MHVPIFSGAPMSEPNATADMIQADQSITPHTFHIPVMGIGFSIDAPAKVAPYGISSVISLVDDILIEKMREVYCKLYNFAYLPIPDDEEDSRAKRITAYLNVIDKVVKEKFETLRQSIFEKGGEMEKYIEMLPDFSELKQRYTNALLQSETIENLKHWIYEHLPAGSIDVNIMTKLDNQNFKENEALPVQYNDAHAALRGFANSNLHSSIVFSAGMNPRLYSYIEQFDDFYPNEQGSVKKKVIIKVSDYRSARIQGQFLAKKGIWVTEYRIESGLNCGGHAFATDGYLFGPILEEFKQNRENLIQATHETLVQALQKKGRPIPNAPMKMYITAQGGVGTSEEHQFLLDYYKLDSVGWGSPFLLVPEVTNVDPYTCHQLAEATENDLHLSHSSPLGIRFHSLKNTTKEIERVKLAEMGRPGSSCPKEFLKFNTEFTERPICVSSRQYQKLKIEELEGLNLSGAEYERRLETILEKSCICTGLGAGAMLLNNVNTKSHGGDGVVVCPGPNIAYFNKIVSLKQMVDHIYGRINIMERTDRPHMFMKELTLYVAYLKETVEESLKPLEEKQRNYILEFRKNLFNGIRYYEELFSRLEHTFTQQRDSIFRELQQFREELEAIELDTPELVLA